MGYISTMTQEDFLEEVVTGIAERRQKQQDIDSYQEPFSLLYGQQSKYSALQGGVRVLVMDFTHRHQTYRCPIKLHRCVVSCAITGFNCRKGRRKYFPMRKKNSKCDFFSHHQCSALLPTSFKILVICLMDDQKPWTQGIKVKDQLLIQVHQNGLFYSYGL